jgi:NhaP-type Na+/H+ or K+/H+ antiporter
MSGDLIVIVVFAIMISIVVVGSVINKLDKKDLKKEEEEQIIERASAKEQFQKEMDKPEIVKLRLYLKDGTSLLSGEINPIPIRNVFNGGSILTREESARILIKRSMERGYFEADDKVKAFIPVQSISFVKIEKLSK